MFGVALSWVCLKGQGEGEGLASWCQVAAMCVCVVSCDCGVVAWVQGRGFMLDAWDV